MRRTINKLSPLAVGRAQKPGYYGDGGGLYLRVGATGAKSWVFRYRVRGEKNLHEMGLGALHAVGLAEARNKAQRHRQQLVAFRHGEAAHDPLALRRQAQLKDRIEAATTMTFRECAEAYIASHKAGWRNPRHAAQWPATLAAYAYPHFGKLPVQAVDVALVMKAVQPIWQTKPETANRLRGRIEAILDWATTSEYRTGENPARWRGHLENLLPKRSKIAQVKHHAALPYAELGAFLTELRRQGGVAARALEFAILTAARTGEVIGARWEEINLPERLWTIPAERMKSGKEHRVPLSDAALAVIGTPERSGFVFPGGKAGRPLSNMSMLMTMRRMGRDDLTAHGFRSSFRDWAAEQTNFPREVAEQALAHSIGDAVEAAYRRGDLLQKRRQLMDAWARHCSHPAAGGEVVAIRA